ARNVEISIIQRKIDVGDQRRLCFEPLQKRRELRRIGWRGGNLDDFLDSPFSVRTVLAVLAIPNPDGRRKILQGKHDTQEAIRLRRVVRRAQLECHLLLGSKLELLYVAPF